MALPVLEAMGPAASLASTGPAGGAPRRMAFFFIPNGVNMSHWRPKRTGAGFDLPSILEPLKPVQEDLLVLTGLAHDRANPNGDGAGDHARSSATFLTASQARKTAGADIRVGISVDQVAAQKIGHLTRFPSLELGCEGGQLSGNGDSGYSCAYSSNISWRSESSPMAKEVNPKLVFERLFASDSASESTEARLKRERLRKSVLDFVMEDAHRLQRNLGASDRRKVDEYLTAVREMELRIERASKFTGEIPNFKAPKGIPENYADHIKLMLDLLVLAFQTDSTRLASFVMANDGSNRAYPFLGVTSGHHDLSHHQGKQDNLEKITRINHFHLTQFAYFLQQLKSIQEGESTLLDNCMIVYGSGISDGDRHNHDDLPVLLAGRGGGTIQPGRHLVYSKTPMANLFLSLLDRVGVQEERFGDSTGRLPQLS